MVPLRSAVHLGGSEFLKVSHLGQNLPMSAVDQILSHPLDSMLNELVWWAAATMAARNRA